jgi:hypothetical protein
MKTLTHFTTAAVLAAGLVGLTSSAFAVQKGAAEECEAIEIRAEQKCLEIYNNSPANSGAAESDYARCMINASRDERTCREIEIERPAATPVKPVRPNRSVKPKG